MLIKGYVEATLRDTEGNVLLHEEGPNTVVQMSNNIVMDAILPRLGASGSATAVADRPEGSNMDDDTTFPNGATHWECFKQSSGRCRSPPSSNFTALTRCPQLFARFFKESSNLLLYSLSTLLPQHFRGGSWHRRARTR